MLVNVRIMFKTIERFLSGEAVSLGAHADKGAVGRNCIKFTEIKLVLKWKGKGGLDPQLMKALEYFEIKMTHTGRSYYMAAQNEVYVVDGDALHMTYSNSSNIESQLKVSYGDSIISPYGMWTFTIRNLRHQSRSLIYLKSHLGDVDLKI